MLHPLFPAPDFGQCFLLVRRRFLADFAECEAKVWDFILDKTLAGYDKAADVLALSQITEGTGLSLNAAIKGLRGLEERGIIHSVILWGKERLVLLSTPANVELIEHHTAQSLTDLELKELALKPLTPPNFEDPQILTPPKSEAPQILGGADKKRANSPNQDDALLLLQLGSEIPPPQNFTPPRSRSGARSRT